jgi:hypothetical protein
MVVNNRFTQEGTQQLLYESDLERGRPCFPTNTTTSTCTIPRHHHYNCPQHASRQRQNQFVYQINRRSGYGMIMSARSIEEPVIRSAPEKCFELNKVNKTIDRRISSKEDNNFIEQRLVKSSSIDTLEVRQTIILTKIKIDFWLIKCSNV